METRPEGIEGGQRNTDSPQVATGISAADPRLGLTIDLLILLLAAILRLTLLDVKPPHFDEGVNGFFVDDMTKRGFYHYDATNFHGPLHFYVLFAAQTLFGRDIAVLRMPLALASLGCVLLLLFSFRRFISPTASRLAALAMAVSPGFVFYGRYAIHESWLVLFLMMLVAGVAGLWRDGKQRDLWWVGLGLAGVMLTKETWVIHLVALVLGFVTLAVSERLWRSGSMPRGTARFSGDDLARVTTVCVALLIFFYSGGLVDREGLGNFVRAYAVWAHTGTAGESGHEKAWWYWFQLLGTYEWPVLLGLVGSVVVGLVPFREPNRFIRWLAITALGTLTAYSIVRYKTPWCIIAWSWPFFLVFGVAVEWCMERVDRWTMGALAGLVCLFSLAKCHVLNFDRYDDEHEPYVYVQTTREIHLLLDPLKWAEQRDPAIRYGHGLVLQEEHHPFVWLLADWPNIVWGNHDYDPERFDVPWLLVDSGERERVEAALTEPYFKVAIRVRGMAPDRSVAYLRATDFQPYFAGRQPEFIPAEKGKVE